jgi:hypothetical protein
MNMEIETEAAQLLLWEYINGIFVAVGGGARRKFYAPERPFMPQMTLAYRLDAISQGPKNSRIPGPNPLPVHLVIDMHASKTLCTVLYKS